MSVFRWFRRRRREPEIVSTRFALGTTPTPAALAAFEADAARGDVVAMANLGVAMLAAGDRQRALHWLNTAWQAGNVGAGYNLGLLHSQAGDTNLAQVVWERAAVAGDPDAMLGLVKQALEREDPAGVDRWVPPILAQDEAFPITALGVALHDHGRLDRAVAAFRRAEELGDGHAMEYRARILEAQGAHAEASALRARAATAERMH
ncbi:tetratricopeptide repeat protein [Kitasatospora sp. LaBMicrA B282]|uniref:tetratricopeptide repeat protein n=1 Tax=Kitasatospora sp. LaBMicrA B282 TaxID=3420949 RepID=UPI003D099FFF